MTQNDKQPWTNRLKRIVSHLTLPERPLDSAHHFGLLYKEKHLHVFRFIYGLCGGPTALVEDLTAETFTRAWHARRTFTGDRAAATGWLLRIARNLVIDHQRNRVEQKTVWLNEAIDQLPTADLPRTEQPEEALIFAEQQAKLLALLQELPPDNREMVTLRYLLGWQVKEIAGHFDLPQNTVTVSIRRSLKQMRYRWPVISIEKEEIHV